MSCLQMARLQMDKETFQDEKRQIDNTIQDVEGKPIPLPSPPLPLRTYRIAAYAT